MQDDRELLTAIDELIAALQQNNARNEQVAQRAELIRRQRAEGMSWTDIVSGGEPLIVELLSQNMEVLTTVGSRIRRLEARALRAEGLSMERIAGLFGVTRQRISELLRSPA